MTVTLTSQRDGFRAFLWWMLGKLAPWRDIDGIPVSLAGDTPEETLLIEDRIRSALELIARWAPKQLVRIHLYMRGIVVAPLDAALGNWWQHSKVCVIDEQYVIASETDDIGIACIIVHELTHARLRAAGFPYDGARRARVERICFHAERNFLHRLPPSPGREHSFTLLARQLSRDPEYWSDEAVRARDTTQSSWWLRGLSFMFRPLPEPKPSAELPNGSLEPTGRPTGAHRSRSCPGRPAAQFKR